MKYRIFWDIRTYEYNPLKVNRRFGAVCGLYLQDRRINQARNQRQLTLTDLQHIPKE
jgi:hypothetical protein